MGWAAIVPERVRREAADYGVALRGASHNLRLYYASIPLYIVGLVIDGVLYSLYLLERGHTEALVGQVNASVALGVILGGVPAGALYTRYGARLSFAVSIVAMAAARFAQLAMTDERLIIACGLAQGVGYAALAAVWPPFLTDEAPPAQRAHVLGLHNLFWTVADLVGSLLSGLFPIWAAALFRLTALADAQLYSMVAAIGMTLLGLLPLLAMHPGRPGVATIVDAPAVSDNAPGRARLRGFVACGVVVFFVGLIIGVTGFFNVYFKEFHGATTQQIGLIAALSRVAGLLGIGVMPAFARRVGLARGNLLLGLITAGYLLSLALPLPLGATVALFLVGYGFMRVNSLLYVNLVMEAVAPRNRGTQSSVRVLGTYLAQAVAGVLGGWLVVQTGYAGLFVFGALAAALAGGASWLFYRNAGVGSRQ